MTSMHDIHRWHSFMNGINRWHPCMDGMRGCHSRIPSMAAIHGSHRNQVGWVYGKCWNLRKIKQVLQLPVFGETYHHGINRQGRKRIPSTHLNVAGELKTMEGSVLDAQLDTKLFHPSMPSVHVHPWMPSMHGICGWYPLKKQKVDGILGWQPRMASVGGICGLHPRKASDGICGLMANVDGIRGWHLWMASVDGPWKRHCWTAPVDGICGWHP